MRIEFAVPSPHDLLRSVRNVPIAKRGQSWSETCLGPDGKKQGVYVIHHGEKIIYVGKTDGDSMTFGVRLRREFQETASQGRHIYPRLAALQTPPEIGVCLLPTDVIREMASLHDMEVAELALVPICETILIAAYKPLFQV